VTENENETAIDDRTESGTPTDLLVQEGDIAGDYLERLLDIADVDGTGALDVHVDVAVVQQTGVRSRLMLDIGGYRARRKVELTEIGNRTAQRVLESGEPVKLAPMTPFERKVVHDAIAAVDGVHSESEGVEPERRVVVLPGA